MFKKLFITLAFLCITIPAFAMRVGNIDAEIENMMCLVYDSGELEAAVTDLTVSGLDGDTDDVYEVIVRTVYGTDTDGSIYLQLNGDYDISNYGTQYMHGRGSLDIAHRSTSANGLILNGTSLTETGQLFIAHGFISASEDLSVSSIFDYASNITESFVYDTGKAGSVWNNSTDNLTSITFHGERADCFGIGSRIIILKKKADDDTGMKVGDLSVSGSIKGTWELVNETNVETPCTDLTISGLHGDTDVLYKISANLSGSSAADNQNFTLTLNGDHGSNYGYQELRGMDTTVSASRGTTSNNWLDNGNGNYTNYVNFSNRIVYAKSGYVRTAIDELVDQINGTTIYQVKFQGEVWDNTTDEITSMTWTASDANGIGVNTNIKIWRLILDESD